MAEAVGLAGRPAQWDADIVTARADLEVVFDMGLNGADRVVLAPRELALPVTEIWCAWTDTETFGAMISVRSRAGEVAHFPWWDHVDRALATLPDGWAPLAATSGDLWSDVEQSWWLSTVERQGRVYAFETDPDDLDPHLINGLRDGYIATEGDAAGKLLVEHVGATWYKVPTMEFRRAWSAAQVEARTRIGGPCT